MSVSAAGAAFVRQLVYQHSAIVLEESKAYLIEARLAPVALEEGFASIDELLGAVRQGKTAVRSRVVEALTTNETSFFRDVAPFECLQAHVLPVMIAARTRVRALTIWCGACSSGQEPYSIAFQIFEKFPELVGWPVRILATDLSTKMLARAEAGRFRQLETNRGLPAAYLVKFFDRTGADWVVKPEVRRLITFSPLNLIDRWTLSPKPDIAFLRNVLIYFDLVTKKTILARVRQFLAPDGMLFLGAAETTLNVDDRWERIAFKKTSYYQPIPRPEDP